MDEVTGETWGKPLAIWQREEGLHEYKFHLKKLDPSCFHYWLVDDSRVIVDYYYEGYCHPVG